LRNGKIRLPETAEPNADLERKSLSEGMFQGLRMQQHADILRHPLPCKNKNKRKIKN